MVAATLCGITDARRVKRSVCAMGHKWMWNASLGGLPPESFLAKVDPLLAGVRSKLDGELRHFGQDRRHARAAVGGETWPARGHSDSRRRLRRALGRDRRRRPAKAMSST